MRHICFLGVTAAILSAHTAAFGVAWVAKHDMTGAGYQTEFNRWTAAPYNLRLTCISGYEEGGAARYAAVWEDASGPSWSAAHGITAAQFTQMTSDFEAQSYFPAFISGFTVAGTPYYNVIWEYRPRSNYDAAVGLTRSSLTSMNATKSLQGYSLVYVSAFTDTGVDLYCAIWYLGSSTTTACRFGLTGPNFQTAFNDLASQGYRLVSQTVGLEGTTERFSGVFRKPFGIGWYAYSSLSEINYQAETWNAYYTGYRPTFVSVYTKNNQSLFNAVWTYNDGLAPGAAQPIHDAVNNYMNQNDVPGLSLAIARNGRLVFAKGFGLADQSINEWVHPNHRFRIASVSKPITATGVLRLRDAGTLTSVNRAVFGNGAVLGTQYGTLAYSTREQNITVSHLLHHTTGWTSDGKMWDNAYGANHAAIIGWQLDNANPSFDPNTMYQYLNVDYCTAGRVIEQLSGKSYEQYVKDEVLAPSGVTDMELGNQTLAGRKLREVVYYQPGGGDPYVTIDPHRMDANGGWIAKPMDLLLFLRRIDGVSTNADILTAARQTEMRTGSTPNSGYGMGIILNNGWWGHNGCMDGTIAFLVHRTDGFDFAVVCNTRPPNDSCAWTLRQAISDAIDAVPASAWPTFDLFPSVNVAYDDWTVQSFPYWARFCPGLKEDFWGPEADFDHDGIQNLFEAYFDYDPIVANNSGLPFSALKDGNDFCVRWSRTLLSPTHGVQIASQYKNDLTQSSWLSGPAIQSSGTMFGVTYETRTPIVSGGHRFQRFRATAP